VFNNDLFVSPDVIECSDEKVSLLKQRKLNAEAPPHAKVINFPKTTVIKKEHDRKLVAADKDIAKRHFLPSSKLSILTFKNSQALIIKILF
jgi:hypothetical protein